MSLLVSSTLRADTTATVGARPRVTERSSIQRSTLCVVAIAMKAMLSVPEKRVNGSCSVCHWPEALSESVSCGVKVLGSVGTDICPTTRRARLWLSVRRRRVS